MGVMAQAQTRQTLGIRTWELCPMHRRLQHGIGKEEASEEENDLLRHVKVQGLGFRV